MARGYLSNRQKNLKIGIVSYTENTTVLDVTGRIGVNTASASTDLDVNGGVRLRGVLYDNNNIVGAAGSVLISTGIGVSWASSGAAAGGANVSISTEAPGSPVAGDLWWDSDVGELYIYYNDGNTTQWVETAGGSETVTVSENAPPSANSGDLWWDSNDGLLSIYYDDGNSAQWIDVSGALASGLLYWTANSAGIHTLGNVGVGTTSPRFKLEVGAVGAAGTSLWVNGDVRITGILTVGTSSITLNGATNQVNVGTGVTIHETNGVQVGGNTVHSTGITANALNIAGVATVGTVLYVGTGVTIYGNTGIISATKFYGDGSNLINAGSTLQASSGTERVVLTSLTSGTMTTVSTNAGLNYNSATNTLSATNFSGNASSATYAQVAGIATYATSAGVSTYATSAGIATYASTAGVATALQNVRTFEITGDVVASAISFDGTGNVSLAATIQPNSVALGSDTTGDYVQSITGTSNQITVTGGTGESSTPTLSIPNQFTAPQDVTISRDLQVNRNLNVNGNITIGGTSATLFTNELKVSDPDLVLGFRTDSGNNDISNDTTANHGGIAIASTEGYPLIQLYDPTVGETNPATYKKIMWFKSGTFSGLGTDAWLVNYAVGIGSTQVPNGVRLAAGAVQFTERDLISVRNVNASGVVTATTFSGNLANTLTLNTSGTGLSGSTTFNNSGASTFTVTSNATSSNTASTLVSRDALGGFIAGVVTATTFSGSLALSNVTGLGANVSTFLATPSSANLASAVTDETGSGALVFATSPTLVTPTIGQATATSVNASGIITATGGFNIGIQSAGVNVTTGVVTAFNFIGAGNTFVYNSSTKTVDISIAGGGGASVTVSDTPPTGAENGDLWYESDTGELKVYYDDGTSAQWVTANGGDSLVQIAGSAPSGAQSGDLWWDSETGNLFVYYSDGTSSQWISASANSTNYWISNNTGIHTLGNVGVGTTNARYTLEVGAVGAAGTSLWVNGNARVTGILSIGQGTVTIDGASNQINVGTGVTINHSTGIQVGGNSLHSRGITVNNINSTGIITATGGLYVGSTQIVNSSGNWIGSSSGITGAQGATGATGAQGAAGFVGSNGAQGAQGSAGSFTTWSKKTATYTAVNGDQIIADTTGGSFTINLPLSPSLGHFVRIADGGDWNTSNLTIGRNGSKIEGDTQDFILDIKGIIVEFIYEDATDGWQLYSYAGPAGAQGAQGAAGNSVYASTSGISTLSQGLTGTPNISVGVITATDYRIQSASEKTTLVTGNTVSLVYNTGGGNIAICTNPSGNITLNVTGIPTDSSFDNYSLNFSVIVTNTGTARSCTAITLNGVSEPIFWFGGSLSSAISGVTTTSGYDIYNFTGINTVGSASTTVNYIILGSVNGSYR